MIDLEKVSFKMPIDDCFEVDEFCPGVIVTGHIEIGTIKPNIAVKFVDSTGNMRFSSKVDEIIYQEGLVRLEKQMLESASAAQDDFWGIALVFYDKEVLNIIENRMSVVIE